MEIIENIYKKKTQSTSVLFNRENIIDSINKLYNGYNFYVQNDIVSFVDTHLSYHNADILFLV